jgi:peptidyl-dipeptidase Dcp
MDRSIRRVPAFNEYNISQIKPAFDVVIKERLSEIEAIANNPKAPTLKMIAQMERAGSDFKRVMTVYGIYSSNLNSQNLNLSKGKWVRIGFFVEQDLSKQKN